VRKVEEQCTYRRLRPSTSTQVLSIPFPFTSNPIIRGELTNECLTLSVLFQFPILNITSPNRHGTLKNNQVRQNETGKNFEIDVDPIIIRDIGSSSFIYLDISSSVLHKGISNIAF